MNKILLIMPVIFLYGCDETPINISSSLKFDTSAPMIGILHLIGQDKFVIASVKEKYPTIVGYKLSTSSTTSLDGCQLTTYDSDANVKTETIGGSNSQGITYGIPSASESNILLGLNCTAKVSNCPSTVVADINYSLSGKTYSGYTTLSPCKQENRTVQFTIANTNQSANSNLKQFSQQFILTNQSTHEVVKFTSYDATSATGGLCSLLVDTCYVATTLTGPAEYSLALNPSSGVGDIVWSASYNNKQIGSGTGDGTFVLN